MNRPLVKFCKTQYSEFRTALVSQWGMLDSTLVRVEPRLKPLHRRYLSLAALATISSRRKRGEYCSAVCEASYLSLVLAAKGVKNSSMVLLRQTIELVLKHVFFLDHPVEHGWASKRADYRVTFQSLLDYLQKTDNCQGFNCPTKLTERINYWYGVLSRSVHVHNKEYIDYEVKPISVSKVDRLLKEMNATTKEVWPLLIVILLLFFPDFPKAASPSEQKLILGSLPRGLRTPTYNHVFRV
jgi:hypothetical protein